VGSIEPGEQVVEPGVGAVEPDVQGAEPGVRCAEPGVRGVQTGVQGIELGVRGAKSGLRGAKSGLRGAETGLQGIEPDAQGMQAVVCSHYNSTVLFHFSIECWDQGRMARGGHGLPKVLLGPRHTLSFYTLGVFYPFGYPTLYASDHTCWQWQCNVFRDIR
jgi:hypothetical protein